MNNRSLGRLLKLLQKNNVKKYKDSEIDIEFGDTMEEMPFIVKDAVNSNSSDDELFDEVDEAKLKEQIMDDLIVTNPSQYEEMLKNETRTVE